MNKYQEALDKLFDFATKDYAFIHVNSCEYQLKSILQEVVDKATAIKPDYEADGYADGELCYDMAYCPKCGKEFEYDINDWGSNYCSECGQKLDWSVEEDDE